MNNIRLRVRVFCLEHSINSLVMSAKDKKYYYDEVNDYTYKFGDRELRRTKYEDELLSPNKIRYTICRYFQISVKYVQVKDRSNNVKYPRQLVHYFLKKHTKLSLLEIAHMTGLESHATVLNSIKVIKRGIKDGGGVREDVRNLELLINNRK